jgi:lysophospholipase L1-like esterase
VAVADRWPDRLVAALAGEDPSLELVANLAVNGYTTADLIREELPPLAGLRPDIVSVLIGVNDVVQGVAADAYARNVVRILDEVLGIVPPDRLVTVGIPDYTVTPAGADYGEPTQRRAAIVEANGIMAALAAERGIAFVDIFDLSSRAASDRSLVASDGLHPSGAQYALWVGRIAPVVRALLAR